MPYYKGLFDTFPAGEDTPMRRRVAEGSVAKIIFKRSESRTALTQAAI